MFDVRGLGFCFRGRGGGVHHDEEGVVNAAGQAGQKEATEVVGNAHGLRGRRNVRGLGF